MKKWAFAITVAFFAIVSVAAGAVALTDDDTSPGVARDADDRGESGGDGSAADCANPPCEDTGGGAAGICLEGAIDCDDTPTGKPPEGDVCIQIFPTPPECADPDAPVSDEPPPSDEPPANGDPGTPPDRVPREPARWSTRTSARRRGCGRRRPGGAAGLYPRTRSL